MWTSLSSAWTMSRWILLTTQLCIGIQDLLDNANIADPAQIEAYQMYRSVLSPASHMFVLWTKALTTRNDRTTYDRKIKAQALERRPQ
jgi:ubiquitin-conjugating enzyme E2 I